jgi:putative endonuclease
LKTKKVKPKVEVAKEPGTSWHVYIVRCGDGTLYTGVATDVLRRVQEHNVSNVLGASYTRSRRPVALVYEEPAASRSAACKREYEIKSLARDGKQALIARKVQ